MQKKKGMRNMTTINFFLSQYAVDKVNIQRTYDAGTA
jgi:hypothetical protein